MRYARWIPWVLFWLVLIVGVMLSPKIGAAWDEPDQIVAAGQYINFFKKGDPAYLSRKDAGASYFVDRIFTQNPELARYPPLPLYVGAAITLVGERLGLVKSPPDIIVSFHLATVLFFALLVVTVYRFGLLLGLSRQSSVFAALLTFLYPTLFGHGLSNLKDTAQVSLFTMSLYYLVRGVQTSDFAPKSDVDFSSLLKGAILWGLALATKFNAVYVPIIWYGWVLVSRRASNKRTLFLIHYSLFIILLVGLATSILVWPYLWFDPTARILEVIRYFASVGQGYRVLWAGQYYRVGVGQALWWYPWGMLFLQTPLIVMVLLMVGIVSSTFKGSTLKGGRLLVMWMVIPLARAIMPTAAFYDGIRHFMEALPPVMLVAAFGFEWLRRKRVTWLLGYLVTLITLVMLIFINSVYFPYSTGYYNAFVRDPNTQFDRDIEALSVKEGVDYLHKNYGTMYVSSPIGGHLSWYYLIGADRYAHFPEQADSLILVNKRSHILKDEGLEQRIDAQFELNYTIRRGDAIFGWVYRRKGLQ